jgi:hypothetical protein
MSSTRQQGMSFSVAAAVAAYGKLHCNSANMQHRDKMEARTHVQLHILYESTAEEFARGGSCDAIGAAVTFIKCRCAAAALNVGAPVNVSPMTLYSSNNCALLQCHTTPPPVMQCRCGVHRQASHRQLHTATTLYTLSPSWSAAVLLLHAVLVRPSMFHQTNCTEVTALGPPVGAAPWHTPCRRAAAT